MKLITLIIALALFACGRGSDGRNGRDGSNGSNGQTPKCEVAQVDGKSYLKCTNADGSSYSAEIKPGQDGDSGVDGTDAVLGSVSCNYDWKHETPGRGFKIAYSALELSGPAALVAFRSAYYSDNVTGTIDQISELLTKSNPNLASNSIASELWEAKMVSKTLAKVKYKPTNIEKDVPCQYAAAQ